MKKLLLLLVTLSSYSFLTAQIAWDGGGDGTSWDDPANWSYDMVPPADSIVELGGDVTITGTATTAPALVRILPHANIVFDLDLALGHPDNHSLVLNDSCTLVLGTPGAGRTISVSPPDSKQGVAIFGSTNGAALTIAEGNTLHIVNGQVGINNSSATSTMTNHGTIIVDATAKNGIRIKDGSFTNHGTITMGSIITDGLQMQGGLFTNAETGSITIEKAGEDAIEIITDGTVENHGSMDLSAKDDAGTANNPIAVGSADEGGNFTNYGSHVTLDGGIGENGRALSVYPTGAVSNYGTLTFLGGNSGSRLFIQGAVTNELDGIIDLTDGRVNVNDTGLLTNNGLIKTTRADGGGIFATGTAVNNAFFDYANGNTFAGGMGAITDNGISVNNNTSRINAAGECTVDIAETPYEWFYNGASLGTADATGGFTFPENSVMADSADLTTTLPGVSIRVVNICEAAVEGSSGLFTPTVAQPLSLFPNPVKDGESLMIDLSALPAQFLTVEVINAQGVVISRHQLVGGYLATIPTDGLAPGLYLLRHQQGTQVYVGRLVVTQ